MPPRRDSTLDAHWPVLWTIRNVYLMAQRLMEAEVQDIVVRGAREHNLRNVGITLPRDRLICFTGVSGSGKSSFAFDTLYGRHA